MSIKKNAICVQDVVVGGEVCRCVDCGHMDVLASTKEPKCPACGGRMELVRAEKEDDKQQHPAAV